MQPDNPKADIEAHGAVPLTAALEQKVRGGELESMEEDTVADYLNRNLKWRIATVRYLRFILAGLA
jgi:tyrosinase